jgi:hypothetical protein
LAFSAAVVIALFADFAPVATSLTLKLFQSIVQSQLAQRFLRHQSFA